MSYIKNNSILIVICLFHSCTTDKKTTQIESVSFNQWNKESILYYEILNSETPCEDLLAYNDSISILEFRDNLQYKMAKCSDKLDARKSHLLSSVAKGFHPSRIDTSMFSKELKSLGPKIVEAHEAYWKSKDTSYFIELEKGTIKEQAIRNSLIAKDSLFTHNDLKKIDAANQILMEKIINKLNGFPPTYYPSHFNYFRRFVKPTIIAGHASDSLKLHYLKIAVADAQKGKLSWNEPLQIHMLLNASGISYKKIKPLWYCGLQQYEDKDEQLLEIVSIFNLYLKNSQTNIKIMRSKFAKEATIEGIVELKEFIVQNTDVLPDRIVVSSELSEEEENHRHTSHYKYVFTIL